MAISKFDPIENDMRYEIWATHWLPGDQIVSLYRSRDALLEKVRALRIEMGIATFMKAVIPIEMGTASIHDRPRESGRVDHHMTDDFAGKGSIVSGNDKPQRPRSANSILKDLFASSSTDQETTRAPAKNKFL